VRGLPVVRGIAAASAAALALAACSAGGTAGSDTSAATGSTRPSATCTPTPVSASAPDTGALLGVSLDWDRDSIAEYTERLGRAPAVAVTFTRMPLGDQDRSNVAAAAEQAAAHGSTLLLTLEPTGGLASVTDEAIDDLVSTVQDANGNGVPVVVRFAHEMNGSWYSWGQQPTAYVKTFRRVAAAVHDGAPGSSMMWAPSYGGGYPFLGGSHGAKAGSKNARALDTNADGTLDERDDSYAPYYPGDAAVDWVGMSLYHWGTKYPWGENDVPAAGKLVDQLRGRYHRAGVDERVVPDFYAEYGTTHDKPVAITETAALYAPGHGGAKEASVKQAWWRQAFAPELLTTLPRLKMVNWFEWAKYEPEVKGEVDWTVTRKPLLRSAFAADLPDWVVTASGDQACAAPGTD
jgi:hypothetical protein